MITTGLPPLPEIADSDLTIAVYTHSSFQQQGPLNDSWGDVKRLEEIGVQVLHMALTAHYFRQKPNISAQEIHDHVVQDLASEKIDGWLDSYDLKRRFIPLHLTQDHNEMRRFFETYVGAVWFQYGMNKVQNWLDQLLGGPSVKEEDTDAEASQVTPDPASGPSTSHPPQYSPHPPTMAPNYHKLINLALVNQTAVSKRVELKYAATSTGQAHLPTWTVRCLVDGQEYGRAQDSNQKKAKEAAARQAYINLGWDM